MKQMESPYTLAEPACAQGGHQPNFQEKKGLTLSQIYISISHCPPEIDFFLLWPPCPTFLALPVPI